MSTNKRERGIGLQKATTWGTAIEPSTGDGIYVLEHTPPKGERNNVTNGDEYDHDLPTAVYPMDYPEQSGTMSGRFYYEGCERLLAALFGIYGSSAPESGVVQHQFTFDPIIGSIFFTVAWDEDDEIKCVPSAKIKSGRIWFDNGLHWEINYGGDRTTVATWSDPLTLSYPSEGQGIFRLLDTEVWINATDGADFGAGDKVYPSGIEINIDHKYTTLPVTAGHEGISEHEPGDDPPEFTVTLNFPKKDSTNKDFIDYFGAGTKKKMRIKMESSAVISGKTSYYTFYLDLPEVYVVEAPEYAQESPIPVTVKFGILKADAAPTGMTTTVPYAYLTNEVAALTGYPAS